MSSCIGFSEEHCSGGTRAAACGQNSTLFLGDKGVVGLSVMSIQILIIAH